MKKIFPFVSLVIFLSIALVSCGKKDGNKKLMAYQTLEERYPGWSNLTWISTDKNSRGFPRMQISIHKNVVTVNQHTSGIDSVYKEYTTLYFLGNSLTLIDNNKGRMTAFYWQTDSTVLLKTRGLGDDYTEDTHTYMLRKN
jgi:hypothetical protein